MELESASLKELATSKISFEKAKEIRDQLIWQKLDEVTVEIAITYWLSTLSPNTQETYKFGIQRLMTLGLIDPTQSLQGFALINHDSIVDRIKLVKDWSECSRQARAACYISFTRFLSRRTEGLIKKAVPSRDGTDKTFFKVREKVKTLAMTQSQWVQFFEVLDKLSLRDSLIAKTMLQGGKRISEVLSLQVNQINWEERKIVFVQAKTKGMKKETVITYPESFMKKLENYIGSRTGLVFITRFGKQVSRLHLNVVFAKAGKSAGILFKVTPHVLRASNVTYLKQQGFADSDIMKITGHANSAMIHAYDKSSIEDNASKKVQLVS